MSTVFSRGTKVCNKDFVQNFNDALSHTFLPHTKISSKIYGQGFFGHFGCWWCGCTPDSLGSRRLAWFLTKIRWKIHGENDREEPWALKIQSDRLPRRARREWKGKLRMGWMLCEFCGTSASACSFVNSSVCLQCVPYVRLTHGFPAFPIRPSASQWKTLVTLSKTCDNFKVVDEQVPYICNFLAYTLRTYCHH